MSKIAMNKVKSSHIQSVGWDSQNKQMVVEWKHGTYAYKTPKKVYDDLMKAESKGSFFNKNVRPNYKPTLL